MRFVFEIRCGWKKGFDRDSFKPVNIGPSLNRSPIDLRFNYLHHSYWSYLHQLSYRTGAPPFFLGAWVYYILILHDGSPSHPMVPGRIPLADWRGPQLSWRVRIGPLGKVSWWSAGQRMVFGPTPIHTLYIYAATYIYIYYKYIIIYLHIYIIMDIMELGTPLGWLRICIFLSLSLSLSLHLRIQLYIVVCIHMLYIYICINIYILYYIYILYHIYYIIDLLYFLNVYIYNNYIIFVSGCCTRISLLGCWASGFADLSRWDLDFSMMFDF
jgi:hypothetical protein